jgi:outer membrane protein TolC
MKNRLFTIVILLVAVFQLVAEDIDLNRAIEIAVKNNEDVLSSKQDLKNSNYKYREALANAFPKLDAELNGFYKIDSSNKLMDQTLDYATENTITLVQPIWVGGKVGTGIKIAKKYKKVSDLSYDLSVDNITVQVKESFYNVLMAKEAWNVIRLVYDNAKTNLDNIVILHSQGQVSEYDLLKARVRVKSIEPQLLQYENNYILAKQNFKSDLGIDLDREINLIGEFAVPTELDTLNFKERALENRKELKMLKLQRDMMKDNQRIAFGDYLPTISAIGQFSHTSTDDEINEMFDNDQKYLQKTQVGLNVQIPLFNGGATHSKVQQAKVEVKKADLQYMKASRQIVLQTDMLYKNLKEVMSEIDLQEETVKESEKALSIANIRYKNGMGTQIEVIDAQTELETARLNYLSTVHKFIITNIRFKQAIGE